MHKDSTITKLEQRLSKIEKSHQNEVDCIKNNFNVILKIFTILQNYNDKELILKEYFSFASAMTESTSGNLYKYENSSFCSIDKKMIPKSIKEFESVYCRYFAANHNPVLVNDLTNYEDNPFYEFSIIINIQQLSEKIGKSVLFIPLLSFEKDKLGLLVLSKKKPFNQYEYDNLLLLTTGLVSALEKINHIETREKLLNLQNAVLKQNYYSSLGHLAAGVAHFVKNSLFNIKGRAGILMKSKNKDEKEYELLETIYRRSLDTERVVNDLLRFAKRDNSTNENSKFDLKNLISSVVDLFNEELRLKNIELVKEFCSDAVLFSGNEFALKECFINLLKNAIEAIQQSGNITITVTQIQNNIVISLANNGIKIDDDDQKKIFDPFFTTKSNSSGIGLFETRKTIEEHGGTIKLTESNDKQTVFTIKLPKFLKQD